MPIESIIGILTIIFMLMAMTRKVAILVATKAPEQSREKSPNVGFKILIWFSKYHRLFAITALLLALFHGALIFAKTGSISVSGSVLIGILIIQGTSGYLLEKNLGNQKIASLVHKIVPFIAVGLVIVHIIVNSLGY